MPLIMKMNLENYKYIIQGWYYLLISGFKIKSGKPLLKYSKCSTCTLLYLNWCDRNKKGKVVKDFINSEGESIKKGEIKKGCGCYIPAKVFTDSKCPLGKF